MHAITLTVYFRARIRVIGKSRSMRASSYNWNLSRGNTLNLRHGTGLGIVEAKFWFASFETPPVHYSTSSICFFACS